MADDRRYAVMVIVAAALWGIIGFFTRYIYSCGISPLQTTFVRCFIALIIMGIAVFFIDRSLFRIDLKDIWMFIGTGLISFVSFNVIMISAQQIAPLSVATVLVYTAPSFVILFSVILFHEKITKIKLISLVLALIGCILATGMLEYISEIDVSYLIGIMSGVCFALYFIFNKIALKKYNPFTILFYTFLIASVSLAPFSDPVGIAFKCDTACTVSILAVGILCTGFAYILYTNGQAGLDAGKASLLCFVEPMVATIVGFLLGDSLTAIEAAGIVMIMISVLILNIKIGSEKDVAG